MKTRRTIPATVACAAIGFALLLCSCDPLGSRISGLRGMGKSDAKAAALLAKAEGFASLAATMGWPKPKKIDSLLKDSEQGIGFKVVISPDGKAMKTSVVWSAAARDKLLSEAAKKDQAASAEAIWHCRPYLDRDSPLPSAALGWNDARLAEWLCWEWAAKALKPKSDSDKAYRASSYLAYKAGQAILIKSIGSGSPVLAQWQEGVWDRRTFQTLAADLKSQVEGMMKANQDPKEREAVLRRIVGFWIKDFRGNYSKRFITNAYVDFGKEGDWVNPTALYAMSWGSLGWQDWEKAFPGPAENLGDLLAAVKK